MSETKSDTKAAPLKVSAAKLTYYDGRLYVPGDTITFAPEHAQLAQAHYAGSGVPEQVEKSRAQRVRQARIENS